MKRKTFYFLILALLLISVIFSCKEKSVSGIILENSLTIWVGESATLTVTFIPADATNKKVIWESSDPSIATVEKGKVTGIARGTATITVTSQDRDRSAQCTVHVLQPIEPEKMIWVEGGTFWMGAHDDEYDEFSNPDELPCHEVTLSGFYISQYMVTQKEWRAAMGRWGTYEWALGEDKPTWIISWNEIQEYISRLNAETGKKYRLPTEAEWEYAARGGNKSQGYLYSGSNNINEVAWYEGNYSEISPLRPVGKKKPNELGIYDMSGNMMEWCSDWYGPYTGAHQTNPPGPDTGDRRVVRGGGFGSTDYFCRNAYRSQFFTEVIVGCGFRLVLPAE